MRKLVLVLIAVLLVFAVSAPAFAKPSPTDVDPGYSEWIGDDDDDDDDGDDDDDHHDNNSDNNTNDGDVTPPSSSEIVVATVSANVNRLLQLTNSSDALLAVSATVPASMKNSANPFSFQADALKTADGLAPKTIPFTLYKIVGDQFVVLEYGKDFVVDWKTGEITINNVTEDCGFLFASI